PLRDALVVHVADGRAGAEPRGRVALAAFGRDPQVGDGALLSLQLGGPLQHLLGLVGGPGDRIDVAVQFDAEAGDRLARLGDAFDDLVGPTLLDADHHDGRDIGVAANADQRAEMQVEVGAELQATVGMRQRQGALDVVGDRLAGGVRQIVERQDDDVIAHANPAVLAAPAPRGVIRPAILFVSHDAVLSRAYQRFVLRLCTWTCSPGAASLTMRPMSSPYLMTVSPAF